MTRLPPSPGSGKDPLTGAPLPRAVLDALAARAAGDPAPAPVEMVAPPRHEGTAPGPSPPLARPAPPEGPVPAPSPDTPEEAPLADAPSSLAFTVPGTVVVLFASPVDMRMEGARARWSVMLAQALALERLGLARVHEGPVALAVAVPAALEGDPRVWEEAVEDRMNVWRPSDRVEALEACDRAAALLRAHPLTPSGTGPAGWRCLVHLAQRMKCPVDIMGAGIQ